MLIGAGALVVATLAALFVIRRIVSLAKWCKRRYKSAPAPGDRPGHIEVADVAEDVAAASRIAATVAAAAAALAAPAGLTALAVMIGLVSAPFIITVAPFLIAFAVAAAAVSAMAKLYSKHQRRKASSKLQREREEEANTVR